MSKVYVMLAQGFEEIEGLTVVDILRRAKIEVLMISITGKLEVTGSHNITVKADYLFEDIKEQADMLVLPGGLPGTNNLKEHKGLEEWIYSYKEENRYLAAVCAAPSVYGQMGILAGKKATCYPGYEDMLLGATSVMEPVVVDGQFITSRGMGTTIEFTLKMVEILQSKENADTLAHKIIYR